MTLELRGGKLLTIVIPTWNRATTLSEALEHLLPQVNLFVAEINVVISDNASEDNTAKVVNDAILKYPKINIIYNKNLENIYFFGNIKKVRELAEGKYIWTLADDDFVCEDIIKEIIQQLHLAKDCALVYLKNDFSLEKFTSSSLVLNRFLKLNTFRVGLISSVIFINNKRNDEFLFNKYNNSAFIGFILLLNSCNYGKNALTIQGKCLDGGKNRQKANNWFDIYINHMQHVVEYMHLMKFSNELINHFRNSYLSKFILPIYIIYKAENKLHFGDYNSMSIKEIEYWIKKAYSDLWTYWIYFQVCKLTPSFVLSIGLKIRHIIKN